MIARVGRYLQSWRPHGSLAELLDRALSEVVACLIPKVSGHLWHLVGAGGAAERGWGGSAVVGPA